MSQMDDIAVVFRGWIETHDAGEAAHMLYLYPSDVPLAQKLAEANGEYDLSEACVSARYAIADDELTEDEFPIAIASYLSGVIHANYISHYSEITGYLWTDQELKIGGHDLLEELYYYADQGKYCYLEITIHDPKDCEGYNEPDTTD